MKPRKASREMSRPAAVAFSGGSGSGRAGTRRDSSDSVLIAAGISTTSTQRFGRISHHLTGQEHGEKIGLDEVYHASAQRFRCVRLAVRPPVRNLSFQELTPVDCGTLRDPRGRSQASRRSAGQGPRPCASQEPSPCAGQGPSQGTRPYGSLRVRRMFSPRRVLRNAS